MWEKGSLLALLLLVATLGGMVGAWLAGGGRQGTRGSGAAPGMVQGGLPTAVQGDVHRPARLGEASQAGAALVASPSIRVAAAVGPTVIAIVNQERLRDFWTGQEFVSQGSGSGVILDRAGHVVTNYHVVQGASRLLGVLPGGGVVPVGLVGADPATDLAVVRLVLPRGAEPLVPATFGDSDRVRVGERVVAIGSPLGLQFQGSVTEGIVSGIRHFLYGQDPERIQRVSRLIQTDAAINPGNSGGALADMRGRVIGINTWKFPEAANVSGMGFAIPADTVQRIVADILADGRVDRAWLGVGVLEPDQARALLGIQVRRGLLVIRVGTGSPAEKAGLRRQDLLLSLGGVPLESFAQLVRLVEERRPGEEVVIRFERAGEAQEVRVRLERMPE